MKAVDQQTGEDLTKRDAESGAAGGGERIGRLRRAGPPLILIPALGCDEELYGGLAGLLSAHVAARTLIVARPSLAASAERDSRLGTRPLHHCRDVFWRPRGARGGDRSARPRRRLVDHGRRSFRRRRPGSGTAACREGARRRACSPDRGDVAHHRLSCKAGWVNEPARRSCAWAQRFDPERFALQAEALAERQDRWGALRGIVCPVLLVWGSDDRYSDPAEATAHGGRDRRRAFRRSARLRPSSEPRAPREVASAAIVWMQDAGLVRGS